uniref:30S ribosomal protein S13, chloroplastic n=1 Tax=Picea sitchensis TaxID=3332 RepID=A9NRD6_PICSI|nr:unknown [Picea sitchensis]ABR16636.1 unknown [Picea sitchensis]ACN39773.1 unknown [Picea sitchensis]
MANAMAMPAVPVLTNLGRGGEINSLMPNKCYISTSNVPKFAGLNIRCARVGGVEIPNNKKIEYSLQYIHGIGRTTARQVLYDLGMENKVTRELNESELTRVRDEVSKYMIEGDLRRFNNLAIRRLIEIQCYRGRRHVAGLPCRGQRTKNNCRTLKGKRVSIAGKKKAPK